MLSEPTLTSLLPSRWGTGFQLSQGASRQLSEQVEKSWLPVPFLWNSPRGAVHALLCKGLHLLRTPRQPPQQV